MIDADRLGITQIQQTVLNSLFDVFDRNWEGKNNNLIIQHVRANIGAFFRKIVLLSYTSLDQNKQLMLESRAMFQ